MFLYSSPRLICLVMLHLLRLHPSSSLMLFSVPFFFSSHSITHIGLWSSRWLRIVRFLAPLYGSSVLPERLLRGMMTWLYSLPPMTSCYRNGMISSACQSLTYPIQSSPILSLGPSWTSLRVALFEALVTSNRCVSNSSLDMLSTWNI